LRGKAGVLTGSLLDRSVSGTGLSEDQNRNAARDCACHQASSIRLGALSIVFTAALSWICAANRVVFMIVLIGPIGLKGKIGTKSSRQDRQRKAPLSFTHKADSGKLPSHLE